MAAVEAKKATMDTQKAKSTVWTTVKPFLNGGLSGMGATCVIQPVDMIKVRKRSSNVPVMVVERCY